jgi:hypothetical protein
MNSRNFILTSASSTLEQPKSQRAQTGARMLKICLRPLELILRLLGALVIRGLLIVMLVLITLLVVLCLIGAVAFGRKTSYSTKERPREPFCRQKLDGETSVLFTFLILIAMHTFSSSLVLRRKEISSQLKEIQTMGEVETGTEYLYE